MFVSKAALHNGLDLIKASPAEVGMVEHIVCRPDIGKRQVLSEASLDLELGLVGDNWQARGNRKTPDGLAHPDMQLNLMNARVIALIAKTKSRWQLAGDQFFVDLDLSPENLPPGTRLSIGSAVIEITAEPHLGCKKFIERFGKEAAMFVNSGIGKSLNLRGVNARVVQSGKVEVGAKVTKLTA
jgi:MOSC domain-containing protein YiiM